MGEQQRRSGKDQRSGIDRRKLKDSNYKGLERRNVPVRRSRKDRRESS